jgi:DNA-binding SARP family transcriptional activator
VPLSTRTTVELAVLGPLAIHDSGRSIVLAGAKERGVLAFLLLRANEVVPAERLIDALWPDDPPATARNSLQVRISHLRGLLGANRIETVRNGYGVNASADELDLLRFRSLVLQGREARAESDPAAAAAKLSDALALWRGEVLPEFCQNPVFRLEIGPLDEERLLAFEAWADVELELDRADELVPQLQAAVADNPLRERLMGQLMLALYRAGRQAEALHAFSEARRRLVDELGLEPGPLLADLQQRILVQDPELAPHRRIQPRSVKTPLRRNLTVAVVSFSVSNHLDPEVAIRRLEEARTRATARLGERGAITSIFSGGVVAAFGLPATREDDPLRAVEVLLTLAEGGEVKVALDSGIALATDDELLDDRVVAEIRALADAAQPGEVVVGAGARTLLGGAVELRDSVVISFDPTVEAIPRNLDAPLIGREHEFARLRDALEWSAKNRRAHLVTVLGPAGIGKSRLARELVTTVGDEATVLTGRCLGYGGGAFWPLAEMAREAVGGTSPEAFLAPLEGVDDRRSIIEQLTAALGTGSGVRAEDAFWAFRKLFGALAAKRPLVLLFENLHWGEEHLLDFVEELVARGDESPMLAICLARPDLLEKRSSWGGGRLDAESIHLAPLSRASSEELIHVLAQSARDDARTRILTRAEGNPLFIEQLVAFAEDDPDAPPDAIPASIHGVLAARVDRLPSTERTLLQRASIVGLDFSLGDAAALSSGTMSTEEAAVAARQLVRKELLRRAGSDERSAEHYRFRHILIHDVIYGSVLKSTRAELHERFARLLESELDKRASEVQEIIGYHLERSFGLRKELDPTARGVRALADEAGRHLAAAGRREVNRSDMLVAIDLLERAKVLLAHDSPERGDVLGALATVYQNCGDLNVARKYWQEASALAERRSDTDLAALVRIADLAIRLETGESFSARDLVVLASAINRGLSDSAPHASRVKYFLAWAHALVGELREAERVINEATATGSYAADPRRLLPSLWLEGPDHVDQVIARCDQLLRAQALPRTAASCFRAVALARAMKGEFAAARKLCGRNRGILEELGLAVLHPASAYIDATVELLAGNHEVAGQILERGLQELSQLGETLHAASLAALLARALLEQGRDDELASLLASRHENSAIEISSRVHFRAVRARLLVRRGFDSEARRFGSEAVELADGTESPEIQAVARLDLAQVLTDCGLRQAARVLVRQASGLYERKGNLVGVSRARSMLTL